MVKTPPYQKRGKCGHFMSQFDTHGTCFGCRAKCKGEDPHAQGADLIGVPLVQHYLKNSGHTSGRSLQRGLHTEIARALKKTHLMS